MRSRVNDLPIPLQFLIFNNKNVTVEWYIINSASHHDELPVYRRKDNNFLIQEVLRTYFIVQFLFWK